MTRLQEVEQLLDSNLQLITDYSKRIAELIGSVRVLEKERDKLTKKNRGVEIVRCKDCGAKEINMADVDKSVRTYIVFCTLIYVSGLLLYVIIIDEGREDLLIAILSEFFVV